MNKRTLIRVLARDLALDRGPAMLRDRACWGLAAAGLVGCAALWRALGVDPTPSLLHGAPAWAGAVVVQPLIEELLFRGLVQGALLRTRAGGRRIRVAAGAHLSVANLIASTAFAATHLAHHTPPWALATIAPSLALGWLRERRDSTWAAVAMHAAFNLEFFATAALFAA